MTELSRIILEKYQVRKTKTQKTEFIEFLRQYLPIEIQTGGMFKSRNLIVGDITNAKVVFTAHYDTCAVMPFPNFITPKNILVYTLYSIIVFVPVFFLMIIFNAFMNFITADYFIHYILSTALFVGVFYMLVAGPANKHTANDNTSGVITLCEIWSKLTDEQKQKVAIVFFDHEEIGLAGSALFKKMNNTIMAEKLVMNFDCVSDGDNILFSVSKAAQHQYMDKVRMAFPSTENKNTMVEKGEKVFYPSDQANFKYSIAVAALKYKRIIGYYMDRIHTPKDTVFNEKNILFLSDGAQRFTDII